MSRLPLELVFEVVSHFMPAGRDYAIPVVPRCFPLPYRSDPVAVAVNAAGEIAVAGQQRQGFRTACAVHIMRPDGTTRKQVEVGWLVHGVAVDRENNLVVVDQTNHRIVVMSDDGRVISCFGSVGGGPGQFNEAHGVAVDNEGNILVADWVNKRVQVLTHVGSLVGVLGPQWDTAWPYGVAVNGNGVVAVAETAHRNVRLVRRDGKTIRNIAVNGPFGVAFDAIGNIVVADAPLSGDVDAAHRVAVFSPSGDLLWECGQKSAGSLAGQFSKPVSVAVLPDGRIVVADKGNRRIQIV